MRRLIQGFFVMVFLFLLTAQAQLTWPPQFSLGQVWQIEIDSRGSWEVELTRNERLAGGVDAFGGQSKKGVDKRDIGFIYEKNADVVVVALAGFTDNLACGATRAGNSRGDQIFANAFKIVGTNPPKMQALNLECRIKLLSSSSLTAAPAVPTVPSPPIPFAPPVAVAQPSTISWPPSFTLGTTFRVSLAGQQPWSVLIKTVDADGKTFRGEGVSASQIWQTIIFYRAAENAVQMDLLLDGQTYSCTFAGKQSIQGSVLIGNAYYRGTPGAEYQDLKRNCELRVTP